MALQFDKARQERREQGCESVQQDKFESFLLEYEKVKREKGGGGGYVIVPPEKRSKEHLKQGECLTGVPITPYCNCSQHSCFTELFFTPPIGALHEYTADYVPIWLDYKRQIRQTHCFDVDVHPGSSFDAGISPYDFNKDAELLMELANRAIQEYNEKECNVFKYKVLKIQKVNLTVTSYYDYWMTVKVLNLTLGTPIETFQIHAGKHCRNDDAKVIYCCQPKEEAVVGLANCDFCFGKLRGEARQGGEEKALEVLF
ncbi:uncharacterized protein LOC132050877 [Lycium ferocissimum]|uniref:uncharacterized protein LOC132050877 n=1 Tax=Lycium ferocissimum TaxID=112874 RepID=UPI002814DB74|nr:uncharacterized protein LOC132050877 [Lycium ferocissimum]